MSTDERLTAIEHSIADIQENMRVIREFAEKSDATIGNIAEQVKPTLDALMKSKLFKLIGG